MKKLKCESCGGLLEIKDNGEYAYCDYCKTKYKLNEDKTITLKIDDSVKDVFGSSMKTFNKMSIIILIIPIVVYFIISGVIMYAGSRAASNQIKNSEENEISYDKKSLTGVLEIYTGTSASVFIRTAIDQIIKYNSKHIEEGITVTYEGITTPDTNQMIAIKKKLDENKRYEITYDYDGDGYIYNMNIN